MVLKVIGAGPSRTGTMSLKNALEHLGFAPCYHMAEVLAGYRTRMNRWLDELAGTPDWPALFEDFQSSVDFPGCAYWRELTEHFPEAKVVLTVRDPDRWFDSVSHTVFSEYMLGPNRGTPYGELWQRVVLDELGDRIGDRAFMTDWYRRHNQAVIDTLPPERLLIFDLAQGWAPLCAFLKVPIPAEPFPNVNNRNALLDRLEGLGGMPSDPEILELAAQAFIDELRASAFPG